LGVHFNHLKALYDFDKSLRMLFFDVLTQLERAFKTAIAYYYSECYANKESYLELNNYYVGVRNENIHLISHLVKGKNTFLLISILTIAFDNMSKISCFIE